MTYRFAFPLDALWRITLATVLMGFAVSLWPAAPTVLSLAIAISIGGLVYGLGLAAVYPELVRKLAVLLGLRKETGEALPLDR